MEYHTHWLPDELITAQKNGELLFFCGAGVSVKEGLPGFYKLVNDIAENVFDLKCIKKCTDNLKCCCGSTTEGQSNCRVEYHHHGKNDKIFSGLMQDKSLDKAVTYLENLESGRVTSRKSIIEYIKKELISEEFPDKSDLSRHKTILELASSENGVRIVTTNFDGLFEKASEKLPNKDEIKVYIAPLVPPVDPNRWTGIIKIHGSLDTKNKEHSDDIVLAAGDFSKAYLTENWATRFIVDMFKHFHVLFVGYSTNDPIFRYIMDALAVDRRFNSNLKTPYIFLPNYGEKDQALEEGHKDIIPSYDGLNKIFYNYTEDHSDLDKKLAEWLNNHAVGSTETKKIIDDLKSPPNIHNKDNREKLFKHLSSNPEAIKYFCESDNHNKTDIAWLPTVISRLPVLNKPIIIDYFTRPLPTDDPTHYLFCWIASSLDKYQVIDWFLKSYQIIPPALYEIVTLERAQDSYSGKYDKILNLLLNRDLVCGFIPSTSSDESRKCKYLKNRIKGIFLYRVETPYPNILETTIKAHRQKFK